MTGFAKQIRAGRAPFFVALAPLALIAGCGGARAGNEAPAAPASTLVEAEPATLEEAEAELARARAALGVTDGDAPPAIAESTPAPEPAPMDRGEATTATKEEDGCVSTCRAIGSMRRAVSAICRLAGDADARCEDARKTLTSSEQSVASCRC